MYFSQNENCQPDKNTKTCIIYARQRMLLERNERKQNRPNKFWRGRLLRKESETHEQEQDGEREGKKARFF